MAMRADMLRLDPDQILSTPTLGFVQLPTLSVRLRDAKQTPTGVSYRGERDDEAVVVHKRAAK